MTEEPPEPRPTGEEVTNEVSRNRAHEISEEKEAGTPRENWRRAEQELRGEPRTGGELRSLEAERDELRARCLQLEHALQSRVLIEQAKGVLAERYSIDPETAFQGLRRAARDQRRDLHELAALVIADRRTPPSVEARVRQAQTTNTVGQA